MLEHDRPPLLLVLVVVSLAIVPSTVAAASVTGTVAVVDGSATGDQVKVTPLTPNQKRAGPTVNTTVEDGRFRARNLADASRYFVQLVHNDTAHYAMATNGSAVSFDLSAPVRGRFVDENGSAIENQRFLVVSEYGPLVRRASTGPNGTFSLGPLQPNHTYHLRYVRAGIPYNETIRTGADATNVTVITRDPTNDTDVLAARGGTPASHVLRLQSPDNGSQVVETVTLQNTGERPFVGSVPVRIPSDVDATSAMYEGKRIPVRQDGRTVTIRATVAPGDRVRMGVSYPLSGRHLNRTLRYDADVAAVALTGYSLSNVEHSGTLEATDAPVPLLVARNVSGPEQVWVRLPDRPKGANGGQASDAPSDPGGTPTGWLFGGLLAGIGGALVAYRVL